MSSNPKYIQIIHTIKQAIEAKQFVDKLPGERVLAQQYDASYMTIRKAIDILVEEGVLYKIPTKGTFINDKKNGLKKTHTIGYFLDSSIQSGISSPYYSMVLNAIEKQARQGGYSVIYFSDSHPENFNKTINKLDGVIATCLPDSDHVIIDIKQSIPIVAIENSSADKTIPSVIIDNFNADIAAVNYASSLGHKRIGYMAGLTRSDIGKNRYAGYQYGLKSNQLTFDESLVFRGDYSYESGITGAEYFLELDELPTAVICANDSMALGAIQQFEKCGMNVPDDISIIGFDDIVVASQITPQLTTIAAPVEAIAEHAFSLLKQLIDGEEIAQLHVALPAELVIRQTTKQPN